MGSNQPLPWNFNFGTNHPSNGNISSIPNPPNNSSNGFNFTPSIQTQSQNPPSFQFGQQAQNWQPQTPQIQAHAPSFNNNLQQQQLSQPCFSNPLVGNCPQYPTPISSYQCQPTMIGDNVDVICHSHQNKWGNIGELPGAYVQASLNGRGPSILSSNPIFRSPMYNWDKFGNIYCLNSGIASTLIDPPGLKQLETARNQKLQKSLKSCYSDPNTFKTTLSTNTYNKYFPITAGLFHQPNPAQKRSPSISSSGPPKTNGIIDPITGLLPGDISPSKRVQLQQQRRTIMTGSGDNDNHLFFPAQTPSDSKFDALTNVTKKIFDGQHFKNIRSNIGESFNFLKRKCSGQVLQETSSEFDISGRLKTGILRQKDPNNEFDSDVWKTWIPPNKPSRTWKSSDTSQSRQTEFSYNKRRCFDLGSSCMNDTLKNSDSNPKNPKPFPNANPKPPHPLDRKKICPTILRRFQPIKVPPKDLKFSRHRRVNRCGVVLTKPDYYTIPNIDSLNLNTDGDRCMVQDFTVGHREYGQIVFPGMLNVKDLDLDRIIHFEHKSCSLYEDCKKPEYLSELHRRGIVTLLKVWPKDRVTGRLISDQLTLEERKFAELLKRSCERFKGKFVEYDAAQGKWVFEIQLHPED